MAEAVAKAGASDGDLLAALLPDSLAADAAATFGGPMDFAQDPDEISVADFANAADLDPNYFTFDGFGSIVARWGGDVAVELGTPVREIRWDGPGVTVVTDRGSVRAEKVLVTVSTGVLAYGGIRFTPDLPEAYDAAFDDLPMGLLTKIPLEVEGERFGKQPFDDLLIERRNQQDIYFLCFPFDLDLMVGFVGGDFAWEVECAGEEAAVDFATERLVRTFGSDARKAVKKGAMTSVGLGALDARRLCRGAAGPGGGAEDADAAGRGAHLVCRRSAGRAADADLRRCAAFRRGRGDADRRRRAMIGLRSWQALLALIAVVAAAITPLAADGDPLRLIDLGPLSAGLLVFMLVAVAVAAEPWRTHFSDGFVVFLAAHLGAWQALAGAAAGRGQCRLGLLGAGRGVVAARLAAGDHPLARARTRSRILSAILKVLVPFLFGAWLLFLWEVVVRGAGVPPVLLPAPSAVWAKIVAAPHILWADFRQTFLKAVLAGYAIGCLSGFLVAIVADRVPFLKRGLLPVGNLVSALPIIGMAPIMVMWFGFDWQSKAAVVVIMTFFPMLVNTVAGLAAADADAEAT